MSLGFETDDVLEFRLDLKRVKWSSPGFTVGLLEIRCCSLFHGNCRYRWRYSLVRTHSGTYLCTALLAYGNGRCTATIITMYHSATCCVYGGHTAEEFEWCSSSPRRRQGPQGRVCLFLRHTRKYLSPYKIRWRVVEWPRILPGQFQESEGGLCVSLSSFLGVSPQFLELHYQKTKEALYLHIKKIKKVWDSHY